MPVRKLFFVLIRARSGPFLRLLPLNGKLLVHVVGCIAARLGSNNSGSYHHTDKCQGNQKIMHCLYLLYESLGTVYTTMIG
jgi:hypothetical protein